MELYQAGDGKRYLVNRALWLQTSASAAGLYAKHLHSKVELMGAVSGREFKCVNYDPKAAESCRKAALVSNYDHLWRAFQAGGPNRGEVVIGELVRMRTLTLRWSESLSKKFADASNCNRASIGSLDNQLLAAQVTRDVGFTIVLAMSTGGAGAVGNLAVGTRVAIGGASIVTKAGSKLQEVQMTVTDKAELTNKRASILLGAGADAVFGAISMGGALKSGVDTFLVAASIKAPVEACKSMLDGATPKQMALAVAFEAFAPFLDGAGASLASKLLPRFGVNQVATDLAKKSKEAIESVGSNTAGGVAGALKDGWAMQILGGSAEGSKDANALLRLLSVPQLLDVSPEMFYRMYAIRPI